MKVTLWGTRGTFPVPGPDTLRFGGDTTCLSVETPDHVLVVDTGTGIRALGEYLREDQREIFMLFTHVHADHVMGFPFFKPLWDPGRTIHVLDHQLGDFDWSATKLLDGRHFPVTAGQVPCELHRVSRDPVRFLADRGINLQRTVLNHPGGAFGYRITAGDRSFAFIPDNELEARVTGAIPLSELVDFCRGVDVLIHDAQFTDAEFANYCGWGHSTASQVCAFATAAGVGKALLTHHDPGRTDAQLDVIQQQVRDCLGAADIQAAVASDGMSFTL